MAGELTVTDSWTYAKGSVGPLQKAITGLAVTVTGNDGVYDFATLSTSPAALNLGTLSGTLGWAWFHNTDTTNDIILLTGSGGKQFARIKPGEFAHLRLGDDVTTPYAKASAGTPVLEYQILPP